VKGFYYKVIGIIQDEGQMVGTDAGSPSGDSQAQILIPFVTLMDQYGEVFFRYRTGSFEAEKVQFHEAVIRVEDVKQVESRAEAIRHLMSTNHKKEDWRIIVPVELLKQAERTKQIFSIVLGSIAAISLLVGGIGIMNIMLASVTERTREIGIRRALGARQADIVVQFLIETVLLAGVGGVLGRRPRPRHSDGRAKIRGRHHHHQDVVAHPRVLHLRDHRHRLRHLPGPSCGADESGRGAAPRIIRDSVAVSVRCSWSWFAKPRPAHRDERSATTMNRPPHQPTPPQAEHRPTLGHRWLLPQALPPLSPCLVEAFSFRDLLHGGGRNREGSGGGGLPPPSFLDSQAPSRRMSLPSLAYLPPILELFALT
jgi:hypothetical protein